MTDDKRRAIGKIISVAADRLVAELHNTTDNFTVVGFDDVHYVARLGSFVVIPVQTNYVVAEVVGLWEKDPSARAPNRVTVTELDKAASSKFLELVPVGMLPKDNGEPFRFGVSLFPSLYADVLYALDTELDRIFEVQKGVEALKEDDEEPHHDDHGKPLTRFRALPIGTSVIFDGYGIKVRLDDFFGGHAAVLGNTGSGKSCTVATILQSLFCKADERVARGASFVILDVNGEYRRAFSQLPEPIRRTYLRIVDGVGSATPEALDQQETTGSFRVPHWFMTVEEWELLLQASERTQRPVLRTALGLATLFASHHGDELTRIQNHILASCLTCILESEVSSPSKKDRITVLLNTFATNEINLQSLRHQVKFEWGAFTNPDQLIEVVEQYVIQDVSLPNYRHVPFAFDDLEMALDLALLYEEAHGNRQIRDYCAQLITRYKWIRDREEFEFLRVPTTDLADHEQDQRKFVEHFLALRNEGDQLYKDAQIIVLDMNDVVDEVVELASAVMARMVFERLRKASPRNRFPVHLILEEAHRYIAEKPSLYAIDASRIFQRIAKEGRKYGAFLMVASQRPSELSRTVLSQCSNFIVHRIQNPDDLTHIRQMTPFVSDSVLKRLPSLPKQHALIFGNAVNLPTTFRVRDVNPTPDSDDARIRELWFRPDGAPTHLTVDHAVAAAHAEDDDPDFGWLEEVE